MVGWHHRLNEHKLEPTPGDGEGQGSLDCCSPWRGGRPQRVGMTERLDSTKARPPPGPSQDLLSASLHPRPASLVPCPFWPQICPRQPDLSPQTSPGLSLFNNRPRTHPPSLPALPLRTGKRLSLRDADCSRGQGSGLKGLSAEGAGRWLLESGRERMEASPAGLPQRKQASQGGLPSHQGRLHPQVQSGSLHAGKRFPLVTTNCCTRQTWILPPGRGSPGRERPRPLHLGPCGPPPSGSVRAPSCSSSARAPSPPPARWLFLAKGGPLPHSPALCRMPGLASAHPAISQTWLTHCLPKDTFPDFQPGSGPHHPLMELPAASLGQTSNTPAAHG